MSEELLLLLEVWALLMYRLSSFICRRERAALDEGRAPGEADRKWTHLAAGQLGQVRLQLLPDHRVDGHQAEDAGLPHAALRVVVALSSR